MYALGTAFRQVSRRSPLRPTSSKRGRKDVSNPVAQTMTSTWRISPDSSSMPSGTNRLIPVVVTSTFGFLMVRRYEALGVILLNPRGWSGISFLHSSSSPPSMNVMYSSTFFRAIFWMGPSAMACDAVSLE